MAKGIGVYTITVVNDGDANYTYIRYSEYADGTNMTTTPTDTTAYMGVCVTTSSTAPSTPSSYEWSRIKADSPVLIKHANANSSVEIDDASKNKLVDYRLINAGSSGDITDEDITITSTSGSSNLLDVSEGFQLGYINSSGNFVAQNQTALFNQDIEVIPGETYCFSLNRSIDNVVISLFDENDNYLRRRKLTGVSYITYTMGNDVAYVKWNINYNNSSTMTSQIIQSLQPMVEKSATRSQEYQPYGSYIRTFTIGIPSTLEIGPGEYIESRGNDWYYVDSLDVSTQITDTTLIGDLSNVFNNLMLRSDMLIEIELTGKSVEHEFSYYTDYCADNLVIEAEGSVVCSPTAPVNPTTGMLWYSTVDDILYYYDGTNWTTQDMAGFASISLVENELLSKNKVWVEKPITPYIAGDLWIVQDQQDPNYGKILTCVNTRQVGNFDINDWIVPLDAYTTTQDITNVLGMSPQEWSSTTSSVISQFNDVNKELVGTNTSVSSLAVRYNNIEMSFSSSGSGNSLPNSSGQYELAYWKVLNEYYSEGATVPTDPIVNDLWLCTESSSPYVAEHFYLYDTTNTWIDMGIKDTFLPTISHKDKVSTIGTYQYSESNTDRTRDDLVAGTSFAMQTDGFDETSIISDPFDIPKSDYISVSYKIYNNTDYANFKIEAFTVSNYPNSIKDAAENMTSFKQQKVKSGKHSSRFGTEYFSLKKPKAEDLITAEEYTSLPAVDVEGTIVLVTGDAPYVKAYRSSGTAWEDFNSVAYKEGYCLLVGLQTSVDPDYRKIYVLKPVDFELEDDFYWEATISDLSTFATRSMFVKLTISPIITTGSSTIPEINEDTMGTAILYTGPTTTIEGATYTQNSIYYGGYTEVSPEIVRSSEVPQTLDYKQLWLCAETQTVGTKRYVQGVYYKYNHANDELVPITNSYDITLIDTEQYIMYAPTQWTLVPYNTTDCEAYDTSEGMYILPVTGNILIGDIMVCAGSEVRAWTCMAGENYWGKIIKFSGKDGILIKNPSTRYQRVLNEYSDISYRLNEDGTIASILWKLTESGMMANDVEVFGDLRLGFMEDGNIYKPIIVYTKPSDDSGIDEYFYTH